jgi:WD40 repeat protein
VRREVAEFATVFIEVAKRSRTPGDVLMSHQLGSLHKRIASIQEQLSRLPNLEGIRTEIARLATENYPALSTNNVETRYIASPDKNQCQAIAIAQQMRGWFETLGYRFEKYEIWQDSYFEWIINIPVRRNRYDRILVRGIAGEAGLADVMALGQSVETQRTDEGWLITARRVSKAARDEVEKEENRHLGCYTFDELLAQDADFSGYLDWLEGEVKHRQIDTKYVPLACSKEEIDPVSKRQIAVSHYDESDGWIDGYIDRWLDDPAKEHISILGEFGTGKTWFALHYAWVTLQRYRDAQKRGTELPRLPLVIPLRDYAKAVSVESLFSEFFFRKHEIPLPGYSAFEQLNRMGKLLLIFDGFDEMAAKVDKQEMINNFWELAKVVVPGAKVILTCRTEHFPEAQEGRALLNAELQASTKDLTGETPQFEVLELDKFTDEQIQQVLSFQAAPATVEMVMGNPQLLDLARRPVMTELILEALPDIEAGKPVDMSRVYLYAVRHKMERDIKSDRTFTSLADKLYFLCELSWEMLSTDQMSLNYKFFPDRIRQLFGIEEKELDHWHYDMMGQTMLIRNADGDYTPAHRSLLEFFVAYKFAAELGVLAEDFTDLARGEVVNGVGQDYTWSSYFRRNGQSLPLRGFVSESLEKLRETFGRSQLTKAVMDLLLPMLDKPHSLLNAIETTRTKSPDEVRYVGGNAATLAIKADKSVLSGKNLSHTVMKGADFCDASLINTNFAEAHLTNSTFTKVFGAVLSVAFSSDGKFLATSDSDGVIILWDAASRKERMTLKGHKNRVNFVIFSPENHILASGSADKQVKLWHVYTGECLTTLQNDDANVLSGAFSPDGNILATGGYDKIVKLWDVYTGERLKVWQAHEERVRSVAFNHNGQILATGSYDKTVKLWDIRTGECLKILQEHSANVLSVSFSPSGEILASSGCDNTIKLWDVSTGKCLKTLEGHNGWVRSLSFISSGNMLASGSYDQTVKIWDVQLGKCLKTLDAHTSWISSVAFNPKNNTLASGGSYDKTIRLWNIDKGECLTTLLGYNNWVNSVVFSPCGETLASGGDDSVVRLWNSRTGECGKTLQGHSGFLMCVSFNPAGNIIASGSSDKTIKLWHVHNGQCMRTLHGHKDGVNSVVFNYDGEMLASSGDDKIVKLWDTNTGKCLKTLQGHSRKVFSVAISPDGQLLASGGADNTIRLWDINTGECLNVLQGHTSYVDSIAFTGNGHILASGSEDKTVKLWNIADCKCVKTLQHDSEVVSVALTPDNKKLISGCGDRTIKIWDIKTGNCLITLLQHSSVVYSVVSSHDGLIIASGSRDETIKLWNINTGDCLRTLRSDRPYENMNITGVKGLNDAEISTLKALGAVEDGEIQSKQEL